MFWNAIAFLIPCIIVGVVVFGTIYGPKMQSKSRGKKTNEGPPPTPNIPSQPIQTNIVETMGGPQKLDELIGQSHLVEMLKTTIEACGHLNEKIPHMIMTGFAGFGKSTFAYCLARELGVAFKGLIAQEISSPKMMLNVLVDAEGQTYKPKILPNSILFIDEIHGLSQPVQEILLSVIQDGYLDTREAGRILFPPFTIVGATTEFGQLTKPFRDRFTLILPFSEYSSQEILGILDGMFTISRDAADMIVKASGRVPRRAKQFARGARLKTASEGRTQVEVEDVRAFFRMSRLDENGLDDGCREVLKVLTPPTGVEAAKVAKGDRNLANSTQISIRTIVGQILPHLISTGLVTTGPRGKYLTEEGMKYVYAKGTTYGENQSISGA